MATQMPPAAQFTLPQPNQPAAQVPQTQPQGSSAMPPVAQFSLPNSSQGNAQSANSLLPSSQGGGIVNKIVNTVAPSVGDLEDAVNGKQVGIIKTLADLGITGLDAAMFIPGVQPEDLAAQAGLRGLTASVVGNAAAGAGLGALSSVAQGGGVSGALKNGLVGGVLGAGTGAVAPTVSKFVDSVPLRITQALGKDMTPESAQYMLDSKTIGTAGNLIKQAQDSAQNLRGKVGAILASDNYIDNVGNGAKAITDTMQEIPNSPLTKTVASTVSQIKKVIPLQADLVDKIGMGTATLDQKAAVKTAIDGKLYPKRGEIFTEKLSAARAIAKQFSDNLRQEIQTVAPETKPLYSEWSKEINLGKALSKARPSEPLTFKDIVTGAGTFAGSGGNPLLTAAAIGGEKALNSKALQFAAAKGLQTANPLLHASGNLIRTQLPRIPGLVQTGQ